MSQKTAASCLWVEAQIRWKFILRNAFLSLFIAHTASAMVAVTSGNMLKKFTVDSPEELESSKYVEGGKRFFDPGN